jgi:hypothetical protein
LRELYEGEQAFYLILELLEGPTLGKYIKNHDGPLLEDAIRLIMKVNII